MTIDDLFAGWARDQIAISAVPTHAERMKEGWEALREHWPTHQCNGMLVLQHSEGIVPDILYEQVRYGNIWVIEAEGVIVERLEAK